MNPGRLADKYLLAPDDILLMSRGLVNYPIILKEFPQPAIAPSTFNVIRANRDVLQPDYLVWAMSQESFQSQLHEVRIGSGTAMIARGDLDELTIPVPPLDMQKKIVQLAELMRYERRLRRELLGETDRLQAAIGRKIINSISDSE